MKQNVNYIQHHKNVNLKLIELDLNATHISLYNALFLIWNECGFDTELSINRNDVMMLSKIGSAHTYTKCLKDLDKHGLIKYKPSHNPLIGSKVNLCRFDNSSGNSSVKSSSKGSGNSIDTLSKQENNETIKPINKVAESFDSKFLQVYDSILNYFPEEFRPKTQEKQKKWLDCIRLLIDKDGLTAKEIIYMCEKVRADDFWQSNFLSILKLRKSNKEGVKYWKVFKHKFLTNNKKDERFRELAKTIEQNFPDL